MLPYVCEPSGTAHLMFSLLSANELAGSRIDFDLPLARMFLASLTLLRSGPAIHWFMSPGRTLLSPVSESLPAGSGSGFAPPSAHLGVALDLGFRISSGQRDVGCLMSGLGRGRAWCSGSGWLGAGGIRLGDSAFDSKQPASSNDDNGK